ncbi:MAG: PAS domain-containing protein, partial [Bdellovibrionota bacterium]
MNGHFPKLTSVSRIREAASQLFNAEQTLYSVIEYAPIVLFALDPEGKFSVCEGQGLENIQVSPGALTGSSVYEEYKDCLWLTDTVRRSLSGQSSSGLGKIHDRWFEFHCLPVTEEGINLGTICVGLDVTERKNAEDELRQSEERFRTLTQATFEGVIIHEKGKILMANPACEKIFGYSPE